jgi:hypothetical protein
MLLVIQISSGAPTTEGTTAASAMISGITVRALPLLVRARGNCLTKKIKEL